ncbi:MAG: 50S ribosomal protein L15 [Bacteroidetes bacterium]|jgi:large subunit ribosomal protein L15|nr:50S ribosomal protein L15 [Bacteroidota bacterium]
MKLHNLKAPAAHKSKKRVGRGQGSGKGEQSGRGHNGQKSRSGAKVKAWFEGGQMPLQRRVPKFGFRNPFRVEYQGVNVQKLSDFLEAGKLDDTITIADLVNAGLADDSDRIKLLGSGEIDQKISIEVHACSASAKEKVESAGGSVTIV